MNNNIAFKTVKECFKIYIDILKNEKITVPSKDIINTDDIETIKYITEILFMKYISSVQSYSIISGSKVEYTYNHMSKVIDNYVKNNVLNNNRIIKNKHNIIINKQEIPQSKNNIILSDDCNDCKNCKGDEHANNSGSWFFGY